MNKFLAILAVFIIGALIVLKYKPELLTGKTIQEVIERPLADTRVLELYAEGYVFSPDVINAGVNETILLKMTGRDNDYLFALPEFAILENVTSGSTSEVEFVADKQGEFIFYCMGCEYKMSGKLIVS